MILWMILIISKILFLLILLLHLKMAIMMVWQRKEHHQVHEAKKMKKFLKCSQEEVIRIRSLIESFYLMTMTLTNTWGKKMKFGKKFDLGLKET